MADLRVASPTTAPPAVKPSPARDAILELKARIGESVLGQDHLVESMLMGLLANGNLLIESLPGGQPAATPRRPMTEVRANVRFRG